MDTNTYVNRKAGTMAQLLKIVLIGPDPCPQCTTTANNLQQKGLESTKQVLDDKNPVHERLSKESIDKGDMHAPLICLEDSDGNLSLFGAGVAMLHVRNLAKLEQELQASAVSV